MSDIVMAEFDVLVIDDNELAAEAMAAWLSRQAGVRWRGWASEPAKADGLIDGTRKTVVLLDVDMPGTDTFIVLKTLVTARPGIVVIMFSGHVRGEYIDRALREGACGYVVKDTPIDAISAMLRKAAGGEIVLCPAASAAFMAFE